MKISKLLFMLFICFFLFNSLSNAQWSCRYRTIDDTPNGTCDNTASVAVFAEDAFVALVTRIAGFDTVNCSYLVGYRGADSAKGRITTLPGYGSALVGLFTKWGTGADTVRMYKAWKIVASPKDSLVYVANNDKDHSILTFKFKKDSVVSAPYRMKTGSRKIWGIDIDNNGRVYVIMDSASGTVEADVKIFESVTKEPKWATTHDAAPIGTLDLPASHYKGIAVDGIGKMLFVADFDGKKVIKYVGSPTGGYTKASGFNFQLTKADSIPGNIPQIFASPMGLSYMRTNNILLVACDTMDTYGLHLTGYSAIYSYGRVYLVDPNTGKLAGAVVGDPPLSVIDQAAWNYAETGSYSSQASCSGYTSTMDVGYDDQGNVYSQSFYGWTVEKWIYFPFVGSITNVKQISHNADSYNLKQNYPNPFNPSTNIEFSVPKASYVTLKVYNLLGQEVSTLINKQMEAGSYNATFNASKLSSGTYFYVLNAGEYTSTMKMVLMK